MRQKRIELVIKTGKCVIDYPADQERRMIGRNAAFKIDIAEQRPNIPV